jgi:hypothetical protein
MFKTGFIFITQPGTFTGNEPAGIETLRNAWAGRFAGLTSGKGSISDMVSSLTVTISSPANGVTITRPDVTVKGLVANTTGNETGVTVNGTVATVIGNQFIAQHVPLAEGSNTITVTATDTSGSTATSIVTINTATGNYIQVTSNIESGIAPLEATLRVDGSFSITSSSINASGPASPEITRIAMDEYKVKMNAEGTYTFTVSAIGPDGNTYQDTVTITVQNRTQLDRLLKAKWEGMKAKLGNGDIDGSLQYFVDRAKDRYKSLFGALIDQLPTIVTTFTEFNITDTYDNVSEYEIVVNESGVLYSYPGTFTKDENGIWKFKDF